MANYGRASVRLFLFSLFSILAVSSCASPTAGRQGVSVDAEGSGIPEDDQRTASGNLVRADARIDELFARYVDTYARNQCAFVTACDGADCKISNINAKCDDVRGYPNVLRIAKPIDKSDIERYFSRRVSFKAIPIPAQKRISARVALLQMLQHEGTWTNIPENMKKANGGSVPSKLGVDPDTIFASKLWKDGVIISNYTDGRRVSPSGLIPHNLAEYRLVFFVRDGLAAADLSKCVVENKSDPKEWGSITEKELKNGTKKKVNCDPKVEDKVRIECWENRKFGPLPRGEVVLEDNDADKEINDICIALASAAETSLNDWLGLSK